ncbi:hypothetical protein [Paenibacillus sp. V4I7]|uniref:hypothetical protein n=1 Tax=Paenibacillus sp. V4I7 TaxID=3042307 RepID=UPI002785303B|nr:hypothetical protein [Paenibacillus sp. V4I7]MDQ0899083.1 hypothetical protein [Paenibacillus sp. V4I7]
MEGKIINYSDFQFSANRWKDFLTPKDKPLAQLIKMDHERIYTSVLFFALTSQELFQVVVDLSKRDRSIRNKLVDLYHALSSKDLPEYVQPLAQNIKNLFFLPVVMDLIKNISPSKTSKYMEKYMNNLVYEYKVEHQDDNENAGVLTDLGLKNPTM